VDRSPVPTAVTTVPRRRMLQAALITVTVAPALGLAACKVGSDGAIKLTPTPFKPAPDAAAQQAALNRALATTHQATDLWAAVATGHPNLSALAAAVGAEQQQHVHSLLAAGAVDIRPTIGSATPGSATPGSATTEASGSPGPTGSATPALVLTTERIGAAQAVADLSGASGPVAGLLAQIAASRAVHVDLLAADLDRRPPGSLTAAMIGAAATPTVPTQKVTATVRGAMSTPVTDPGELEVIQRLLAGAHAAVYGYGVIVGRSTGARRSAADADLARAILTRDNLSALIVASAGTPIAAQPAYAVGNPVTAAQLRTLGSRIEAGLAGLILKLVLAASVPRQLWAAVELVEAARRRAGWTGTGEAFPGA